MKKAATYCALDVSSSDISCVLACVNNSGKIVESHYQNGPSSGFQNAKIIDAGRLSEAISAVMNKLQAASPYKIKSVYASCSGANVLCRHSIGVIPLSERANKIITLNDIRKVNDQAYSLGVKIEEEVLHRIPQGYTVDGQDKILRPEGLYGRRLEVDLLLLGLLSSESETLVSAIDRAGFSVALVALSALVSSTAVAGKDTKEKGCCFLDIQADTTQLIIFKDGILRGAESFNFGANSLSAAICAELKVPMALAEGIKNSYGCASSVNVDPEQEVLIKNAQGYRPIKRKIICGAIENRLNEFFSLAKEKLQRYNKNYILTEGVIASGKTALMEGFLEVTEAAFSMPVGLAKISEPSQKDLIYSPCIGLIKYAWAINPQINLFKMSSEGNVFHKIMRKSVEIYQEYF